ncbi:Heme:hemopexin utilization protein A [Bordetella ansorpii]|uniref:Heme:hemopexin utilization protein A n=1 Tax=Bordetella ansorpii TaxID=288768 RepID=A0A157S4N2_9BORD|nr:filamentous hemagglutinin N-terminal domain-containing protein [Bordetella ansorpii]SAI65362.1 Heme:hemopexin utilization protein A [Bordetella ansorpii]
MTQARTLKRSAAKPARRLHLKKETAVSALPALSTLAMVLGSIASPAAFANPTGGNVVAGSATINDRGNGTVDINQSTGKAIINWKDFSIGANETVNFRQPGSKSVTLNRVVGNDPSAIFGKLNANGTVMLVNPNGVVFGKGARIDVGGLVATTANINDKDFLAGNYKFDQASKNLNAAIVNEGTISIKDSGLAALVAPSVKNAGVIQAKLGKVALAGAKTVTVDFQGDGLLSFDASSVVDQQPVGADGKAVKALVHNTGVISADGGTVLMTARAVKNVVDNVINTEGIVSAKSVGTKNGKIVLSGGDAGIVNVAGTVDASGKSAGQTGGKVVVTGEHVKVAGNAVVEVSGAAGGGEIALGSLGVKPDDGSAAFSGKSQTVSVARGAKLKADAIDRGNGGSVTMWSNEATAFAGDLSARGGANGGDGGFAEVSSKKNIGLTGNADLRAPKGKTGTLLIDPTDLRIVAGNSGDQDGAAADGTINNGDENAADNTVSVGLLESLAGNANIKLEATGLVSIASDVNAIALQTVTGNTFTLRSTQSGGIKFENSNTEISTQGGNITLEALGVGSKLDNIGKLTSNGGAITLSASGDINLANVIDAGSGAALVQSTSGSIYNTGGYPQRVKGSAVTLSAENGNVGSTSGFVNTEAPTLAVRSGGDIAVESGTDLSDLTLTHRHADADRINWLQVKTPSQIIRLQDGSLYTVDLVRSATDLNFSFTGDRSIAVTEINLTGGSQAALTSTNGGISSTDELSMLKAGSVTLRAANGAIGSAGQALNISTATLAASADSAGIYLRNTSAAPVLLSTIDTTGTLSAATVGTLILGNVKAGGASLRSETGDIQDDGNADTLVSANSLILRAETGIGPGAAIRSNASYIDAVTTGGLIAIEATNADASIAQASTQNNTITITGTGGLTVGSVSSGGGAISLSGKSIALGDGGTIDAGTGTVALSATQGDITGTGTSLITGSVVTLLAPDATGTYTIGKSQTLLRLAAGTVVAKAGSIYLDTGADATRLSSLKAYSGITVRSQANVTAGQIDAGVGALSIETGNGAILGQAGNLLAGQSVALSATQDLGNAATRLRTRTADLSLTGGADIYLDNTEKSLDQLSIVHTHADDTVLNTLSVTSPYLDFDITDLADGYHLNKVYSTPLTAFSFSGDRNLTLGNIKGGGWLQLTARAGDILDDGDNETRVTAGDITLSALQGSIGTSVREVETNASSLTLVTRGNLYATSVADLGTLTIEARHASDTDVNELRLRAPSLLFDVLDSTDGYTLREVRDSSSLSFNFTSDRNITVGNVDASPSGSITLNAESGAIQDDGSRLTWLLADSVTLYANQAVGASDNAIDVRTAYLSGNANNGGYYVRLPSPAGSSNYTDTINLGGIYAQGDVAISALQGDLALTGTVQSYGGGVTLAADTGAIANGNGYGIIRSNGNVSLTAWKDIGAADLTTPGGDNNRRAILLDGTTPLTLTVNAHQSGRNIFLSNLGSGTTTLSTIYATGRFDYKQTGGDTVVGNVRGTAATSLANTIGSILDDGDTSTRITSNNVLLSAGGDIGTADRHLQVATPALAVTATGQIAVDNNQAYTSLDITHSGFGAGTLAITGTGQTFTLSDDGAYYHLTQVLSTSPLAFSFTAGYKSVLVGDIDVGTAGSVKLTATNGNVANEDLENPGSIRAGKVTLSAGSGYSLGSADEGGALQVSDTTDLDLTAGRNMFVASDTALSRLAITSTDTNRATSTFAITAPDQTYTITDLGYIHRLSNISGAGLADFSFTNSKSIETDTVATTNSVSLSTEGGGYYSYIRSVSGGTGRITSASVSLSAIAPDGQMSGAGSIGGTTMRLSTQALKITATDRVQIDNGGTALQSIDLDLTQRNYNSAPLSNSYSFQGLGAGQALQISQGSYLTTINATLPSVDFSLDVNTRLQVNNLNTGPAGSVALTTRETATDVDTSIGGSGTITAGSVLLGTTGDHASISARTATANLALSSKGSIAVNNSGSTLDSLSIEALHREYSQQNSYAVISDGLTFSVSDSPSSGSVAGVTLTDVSTSGNLDFSFASDRALTVDNVQTGAGGSVTLQTDGILYGTSTGTGGSNPGGADISTGDLTLIAGSVQGRYNEIPSQPLYISVNTLSSDVANDLWVSNDKDLALLNNKAGSSATVAVTSGSISQSGTGRFVAPVLSLSAQQSVGVNGTPILTDTRRLTTRTGESLAVQNASNLFSLDIGVSHATAGSKFLSVTAEGLSLSLGDNSNGAAMIVGLSDTTGIDFTLSSDNILRMNPIDVGAGHSLSLSGTSINNYNFVPSVVRGDRITLSATGTIGSSGSIINTATRDLTIIAGNNAYVANDRDLLSLTVRATAAQGTPVAYGITAPELAFTATDDGTTTKLSNIADDTGLNFTFRSTHALQVGNIDVLTSGTVNLESSLGVSVLDPLGTDRITAGQVYLTTTNGSAIGADGAGLRITAPLLTINNTGDVYVDSNTHLDSLTLYAYGNDARSYGINAPTRDGLGSLAFEAEDDGSTLYLKNVGDADGMALNVTSSRGIKVGAIDVGNDDVSLSAQNSSLVDDGDADTRILAGNLRLSGDTSIGTAGHGIDSRVDSLTANSRDGGVNITLNGTTSLQGLTGRGDSSLVNYVGDIALGSINLNGYSLDIDNRGGSILSGTIRDTANVILKAAGSIGNDSAIQTYAYGGGTTNVTLTAQAANGADGSIALQEQYALNATNVTADGDIALAADLSNAGYALTVGNVQAGGDVTLSSQRGNIAANDPSNLVKGQSVTLLAGFDSFRMIGDSGNRLNVDAASLSIRNPGSIYINSVGTLTDLAIDRTTTPAGSSSGGTLSLTAGADVLLAGTESNGIITLDTVTADGLNFSLVANGGIRVDQIDVGNTGTVSLTAGAASGTAGGEGSIGAAGTGSLITAGKLILDAGESTLHGIGDGVRPLYTQVGSITATAGGSIWLKQNGTLDLENVKAGGGLSVWTTSGDILVGQLQYGANNALTLLASAGSIKGNANPAAIGGSGGGSITLTASDGIGTRDAALQIQGGNKQVIATVTGDGSLYLANQGDLLGTLTTSVNNGATVITSTGSLQLANAQSLTDAEGNDITVSADGYIITGNVTAGIGNGRVSMTAGNGNIYVYGSDATIRASTVTVAATGDIGHSVARLTLGGQHVDARSQSGTLYLKSGTGDTVFAYLSGRAIDVVGQGNLQIANAIATNGDISVVGNASTANKRLTVGNIDAGSGMVSLQYLQAGGTIVDDGNADTRVAGHSVVLGAGSGIGGAEAGGRDTIQTTASVLQARVDGVGAIHIDDDNAAGVQLTSVSTVRGPIGITAAGNIYADAVFIDAPAAGSDISLQSTGGGIVAGQINAGDAGDVTLEAQNDITANSPTTSLITAKTLNLTGANLGSVYDLASGDGVALRTDVSALGTLHASRSGVISLNNIGTAALVLNAIDQGGGGSVYLRTAGDLDAGAGIDSTNLLLKSGGTLKVQTAGIEAAGTVTLIGATNVISAGEQTIRVKAGTLNLSTGSVGGDTVLVSEVGTLNVTQTGASTQWLTVNNTGDLDATISWTGNINLSNDGNLTATSIEGAADIGLDASGGIDARAVSTSGSAKMVTITATNGDIIVGDIDGGAAGVVTLLATQGGLAGTDGGAGITAGTLNLTSRDGIGAADAYFTTGAPHVSATVLGTGSIYLQGTGLLTLDGAATTNGDIHVITADDLTIGGVVQASKTRGIGDPLTGQGGHIALTSTDGDVLIGEDIGQSQASSLSITGNGITLAGVDTSGSQTYVGNVTLNGNLTAGSIDIQGDLALTGSWHQLITSAANGDIEIDGTVTGGDAYTQLQAGTGSVTLHGSVVDLGGLDISAGDITLASVTTRNGQGYSGDVTLNGNYTTTQNGGFTLWGSASLGGDVTIATGSGAIDFETGVSGAHALTLDTSGDSLFKGAIGADSFSSIGTGTITLIGGGGVTTTGTQYYNGKVILYAGTVLSGSHVTLDGGVDSHAFNHDLTIVGDTTIGGAIGAGTKLGSLTIDGAAQLQGAPIATTGLQHYKGAVTLSADQTLTTENGNVTFDGEVAGPYDLTVTSTNGGDVAFAQIGSADVVQPRFVVFGALAPSTGRIGNLSVNTAGETIFNDAVYAQTVTTDAPGTLIVNGGLVDTTGSQVYGERAVLGADTTLTGDSVTLSQGADATTAGGQSLTVSGYAYVGGAIGANAALASLTLNDVARLGGGTIQTTGNQVYGYDVTLEGDHTLSTTTGNVTFAARLGGEYDLTVTSTDAGNVSFNEVGASTTPYVRSVAPTRLGDLTVNTAGLTTFGGEVRAASVTTDVPGSLALNGGLVDTTGSQSYGERALLGADTQLQGTTVTLAGADGAHALTISGNGVITGAVGANTALATLTITGDATLGAGTIATTGAQAYQGDVTLTSDLSASTVDSTVAFSGTVTSAANGGHGLTVSTGTADATFTQALGDAGAGRLGALVVDNSGATTFEQEVYAASVTTDAPGTLRINGGRVDTTGTQSYGERAVLGADTTLKGTTVTLAQGADGATAQAQALTIEGNASIGGALGSNATLAALTITGNATLDAATIQTAGAQSYQGNVTLNHALQISTDNANVGFGGTVTSAANGGHGLTVGVGTGNVTFAQALGNDTTGRLGALDVNSSGATTLGGAVYAASVNTDAGGTLAIDGGRVDTTGTQYYGELAVLGANTRLKGSSITLSQGADAATEGAQGLTIDGNATLDGALGATRALASLAVTGATAIDTGRIATTGSQSYEGAVTLGQDVALATQGGNVHLGGTLEGEHSLAVTAGGGDVSFGGAIGAAATIGDLSIDTTGATTFSDTVRAASLSKTGTGSVAIDGGSIQTTGGQSYAGHVTLGQDTGLGGTEIQILAGADGSHALTLTGDALLGGDIGAAARLASLTVTGLTTLNAGSIATTGAQSYQDAVTLAGAQSLATQGGAVSFAGTLSGSHDLNIATQDGDVAFSGAVGSDAARLGNLSIDSAGLTRFGDAVQAASVQAAGQGTLAIDGGTVHTVGAQQYDGRVLLGADTTLTGSQVALLGGGDGAYALDIDGNAILGGTFGANAALASLTVHGDTALNGGSIATTGDQSYLGAVTLAATQALASASGNIGFDGTVDGSADFSVQAGGDIAFAGTVGAANRLGALVIDASGDTRFDGAVRAASVSTSEAGTLQINGGSVDTTGTQTYGERAVLGTDTVLSGATVTLLAGADAAQAGQQGLRIAGNADIRGNLGAQATLRDLAIEGATAMDGGSVATAGDQIYGGAVAMTGARDLASGNGSIVFGSTLDGAGNNLSLSAANGDIRAAGNATNLGALTLQAVNTIVFNGDVSAYRVQQLQAQSATYQGKLTAADSIDLTGGSVAFGGDVSAENGAIRIVNTDNAGSVTFTQGATVRAASGFSQTGGAALLLPAQLLVDQGAINLGAVARIQGDSAVIRTNGDLTATGIIGPQATLNVALGAVGNLAIGINDADPSHKLDVAVLAVPSAGSAQVYGTLAAKTGAFAASLVTSSLAGAPFYMNGAVWGPTDVVNRVAAVTAPRWIAPSKPTADSLFRGTVTPDAYGPDVLGAYLDPQVLRVAFADTTTWQLPAGDVNMLNVPSGNGSVLQAPTGSSQQPAIGGSQSSDDQSDQTDAQRSL